MRRDNKRQFQLTMNGNLNITKFLRLSFFGVTRVSFVEYWKIEK